VSTVVVYVHGLWLTGIEGGILRKRLAKDLSAQTRAFSYASVNSSMAANAQALAKFLGELRADTLHLVGHSLGGLVILQLFEGGDRPKLPPGRIVLLGSPLNGSLAARNLARLPFGRAIMGPAAAEELLVPRAHRWNGARELGVIAGDLGFGLGSLVGTLGRPSDGTIRVEETGIEGAADRVVLRVSHSGMLFSAAVARAAGTFLSTGRFGR
jgi:pimeloyl-ACP methyl ester carboxylesterase